jgi:hypothetical protein
VVEPGLRGGFETGGPGVRPAGEGRPRNWPLFATIPAILALSGCGDDAGVRSGEATGGVRLELVERSAELPFSESSGFAVAGNDRVCLLESYSVEIVCGDRGWRAYRVIAREGPGPGEIGPHGDLLTWTDGSVAYLDRDRLSFFSTDLAYAGSVRVPAGLIPISSTVDGTLETQGWPGGYGTLELRARTIDTETGEEARQVLLAVEPGQLDRDSAGMIMAAAAPGGRYLVRLSSPGWDGLAWFDRHGRFEGRTVLPDYGTVYPSERDVEETMAAARRLERIAGERSLEDELQRYRDRPLGFFPRGSPTNLFQFDGRGRLWVRSTRPSETGSHLELFAGGGPVPHHVATVEVAGRVQAFQVVDTLLVALAVGLEPDSVGVYPRRFDWYRIRDIGIEPSGG